MSLPGVESTRRHEPLKMLLYGRPKTGKSTFASKAPQPVFIQTEAGLSHIDTDAFSLSRDFTHVIDSLRTLLTQDHAFQTVIIDTLDWLEPLIWQHVCQRHGIDNIERLGYGKGYIEAELFHRQVLQWLDACRTDKNMNVILVAHDDVRTVEPPDGPTYQRYQPKLHKRAMAVYEEWADVIAFACQRTNVLAETEGFNKRTRAVGGEHVIRLNVDPSYLAGSRFNLPDELPLDWSAFAQALSAAA